MSKIIEMKASIHSYEGTKTLQFQGAGLLVGNVGNKELSYTNFDEKEKKYRLATVKCNIPTIGEKTLLLQVHEGNLKGMVGLKSTDEWENEDQAAEAVAMFESGENYLTTVRRVAKKDGSGFTLLGNVSHLPSNGGDNNITAAENNAFDALYADFDDAQDEEAPVASAPSIGEA